MGAPARLIVTRRTIGAVSRPQQFAHATGLLYVDGVRGRPMDICSLYRSAGLAPMPAVVVTRLPSSNDTQARLLATTYTME